jgi:hypothetical protein
MTGELQPDDISLSFVWCTSYGGFALRKFIIQSDNNRLWRIEEALKWLRKRS